MIEWYEEIWYWLKDNLTDESEKRLRKSFELNGLKKGIHLLDEYNEKAQIVIDGAEEVENVKKRLNDYNGDSPAEFVLKEAIKLGEYVVKLSRFHSVVKDLAKFIRSREVLDILVQINTKKTLNELHEIDQQLNRFLRYNTLESIIHFDKYPPEFIKECKEQLNRISLNYGENNSQNISEAIVLEELEIGVEFPNEIFLTIENFKLFEFLVDKYASSKRPVDLSHIYRWMLENSLIAKRVGNKYMNYCRENNLVNAKFARITDPNRTTRTQLNELQRVFNQSRVKTTK